MIWHGGQEGLNAEGVKQPGSMNARDRMTPCCLVATLEYQQALRGHLWASEMGRGMDPREG